MRSNSTPLLQRITTTYGMSSTAGRAGLRRWVDQLGYCQLFSLLINLADLMSRADYPDDILGDSGSDTEPEDEADEDSNGQSAVMVSSYEPSFVCQPRTITETTIPTKNLTTIVTASSVRHPCSFRLTV